MDNVNIILGPPGTGKTSRLLNICREKKSEGIDWDRIGFFSFSQKAAYEARDRACEKFNTSRKELVHFRTLHSYAYRHLPLEDTNLMKGKHWKELSEIIGFDLTSEGDDETIYTNANHRYLSLINMSRLKGVPLREAWNGNMDTLLWSKLDYLNRAIIEYKKERKLFDYTDMIVDYVGSDVQPNFDALFIDEAQDMPKIQYDMVFKLINGSKETYLAGDDDQAIFRWSGADVDRFIKLKGNVEVLGTSYRCPRRVYRLANTIIGRVKLRRPKTWEPKEEDGKVMRVTDLRYIDISKGKWLFLARTKRIRNEVIEDYLYSKGYWYGRGEHRPVAPSVISAIDTWQQLQRGEAVSMGEVKTLYNKIKSGTGIKRGGKKFKEEDKEKLFTMQNLIESQGLIAQGEWHEVLDRVKLADVAYLRRLEKMGEDIKGEPRLRVSTIHKAKGGECDNVVVLLDVGKIVYNAYIKNPDDEHRIFYVAVTRAKECLYIVEAQSEEGYMMYYV